MDNKTYSIYVFMDNNGIPFYVGKTSDIKTRIRTHKYHLRYKTKRSNYPKYNKLRKLINDNISNFEKYFKTIESGLTYEQGNENEINLIKEYKINGVKLTNLTDGGDGNIASIPGLSNKLSKIHKGRKVSIETRKRISDGLKGKPKSDEHKKNLSIAWETREPMKKESFIKRSITSTGNINIKKYKCTSSEGIEYITEKGLTYFCKQHNLTQSNMHKVSVGERKHHKGWKCKLIE